MSNLIIHVSKTIILLSAIIRLSEDVEFVNGGFAMVNLVSFIGSNVIYAYDSQVYKVIGVSHGELVIWRGTHQFHTVPLYSVQVI